MTPGGRWDSSETAGARRRASRRARSLLRSSWHSEHSAISDQDHHRGRRTVRVALQRPRGVADWDSSDPDRLPHRPRRRRPRRPSRTHRQRSSRRRFRRRPRHRRQHPSQRRSRLLSRRPTYTEANCGPDDRAESHPRLHVLDITRAAQLRCNGDGQDEGRGACKIIVMYKSGPSKAQGLGPTSADASGVASWTWTIGPSTTLGTLASRRLPARREARRSP